MGVNVSIPEDLRADLEVIWAADTAVDPKKWDYECPRSTGQCAATALIVNALFGGEIIRYSLGGMGTHYANLVGSEVVDLTDDQFDIDVSELPYESVDRITLVTNDGTYYRFALLSERLKNLWESQRRTLRLVVNG